MTLSNKKIFINSTSKLKYRFLGEGGFSIIELLIATSIFSVIGLASLGIFTSVLNGQRKALAQSRLQREAQLIMETVTKKIRTSRVDYTEYEVMFGLGNPILNPVQELILIDQADSRVRFIHNQTNESIELQIDTGLVNTMTPEDVDITLFNFFIVPTENPFTSGSLPSIQPRVTFVMTIQSGQGKNLSELTVQQTIPQRGSNY